MTERGRQGERWFLLFVDQPFGSTSLTVLSSTAHFVLRLSVEGRSLRLEERLPKDGEREIEDP